MKSCALAWLLALTALSPYIAHAAITITEIMYDPKGADTKREWIEIHNAGAEGIDLSGYTFVDTSNHRLNVPPKNGGIGSMVLMPGTFAIIAADAATFTREYPTITPVIDSVMNVRNTEGYVALNTSSTTVGITYTKALGAAGDGDSLQYTNGAWIHAMPTPGAANARVPSVQKAVVSSKEERKNTQRVPRAQYIEQEIEEINPVQGDGNSGVVALVQSASAGSVNITPWWIVAGALAIGTSAIVMIITRTRRSEWDIVEE